MPRSLMLTFDITAALLCCCSDSLLSQTVPTAFAPAAAHLHFCSGSLMRSYAPTATLRAAELNCRFCTVPSDACACTLPYTTARFLAQECLACIPANGNFMRLMKRFAASTGRRCLRASSQQQLLTPPPGLCS